MSASIAILVPGTWARGVLRGGGMNVPSWCEEGSLCRRRIREALGPETRFHIFYWSGANSPDARLAAAKQLAALTKSLSQQFPDSSMHIIAHSHGGNIAFYAARDPQVDAVLDGIVCLSTPFLHVAPRELGESLAEKLEQTASFSAVVLLTFLLWVLFPNSASRLFQRVGTDDPWGNVWAGFTLLTIAAVVAIAISPALRAIFRRGQEYGKRLRLPSRLNTPVLIVRSVADEASAVLGTAHFVSISCTRLLCSAMSLVRQDFSISDLRRLEFRAIWRKSTGLYRLSSVIIVLGISIYLLISLVAASFGVAITDDNVLGEALLYLPLLGFLLMGFDLGIEFARNILAISLFILLSLLLAIFLTPFGFKFASCSMALHISAESTPPGEWQIWQLDPDVGSFEAPLTLSHGTHTNTKALDGVSKWLACHQ